MDLYEARKLLQAGKTIYDLPLRVTYYARVSTDKDAQLHSLSAQVAYYTAFIQDCPGWTFVPGYVDEGLSGTGVEKRTSFLRMLDGAQAAQFDFVVTKEISRFSRNTLDSIRYTQELLKCGVGVFFQSDNINTLLPDAELRLTIMASIAQDEVRKISERVKFGFKRAIENGVVLGNSKIWGYEKQAGRLVVVEEEAELIRLIFDLYANEQQGLRTLAQTLTARGYRNGNGNPFSFSTLRGILTNPKYKGDYCGGKTHKYDYKINDRKHLPPEDWVQYRDEANVPPLVSPALWDKANRLLARRGRDASKKTGTQYPYSGKLLCGTHHTPYYRALYRYPAGDKEVWQCREYVKNGRDGCKAPILYTAELDEIIRQLLAELFPCTETLARELTDLYAAADGIGKVQEGREKLRREQEQIRRRQDKLLDLSVAGQVTDDSFFQRNRRFEEQLTQLEAQLSALEAEEKVRRARAQEPELLGRGIARELRFAEGFDGGVIDALVEHGEVFEEPDAIRLLLYCNGSAKGRTYLIRRRRGQPSVCTAQYI
ncbi:MAG: recombinase family protein [Oscillospiraceae bacterium]